MSGVARPETAHRPHRTVTGAPMDGRGPGGQAGRSVFGVLGPGCGGWTLAGMTGHAGLLLGEYLQLTAGLKYKGLYINGNTHV